MLRSFISDKAKFGSFKEALDACCSGVAQDAIILFDQWRTNIQLSTYIASISEHDDTEDLHGRLSMWRAFGGNAPRVAIEFKVPWFSVGQAALSVVFNPVAYLTDCKFHNAMDDVIKNIRANSDFLRSIGRSVLVGTIFNMLVTAVTCLKHEGFHEEREWRVIYSPRNNRP